MNGELTNKVKDEWRVNESKKQTMNEDLTNKMKDEWRVISLKLTMNESTNPMEDEWRVNKQNEG